MCCCRAVIEKQLPFGELDTLCQVIVIGLRGRFAELDEGKRVPFATLRITQSGGLFVQGREHRMSANAAEPVARVIGIAFHAMHDAVPVLALRRSRNDGEVRGLPVRQEK